MLTITELTYRIGGRLLIDKANLQVSAGHRVGLVGPNGTGKSTLFKLISGELAPDGGEITIAKDWVVGMVRQDLPEDDTRLIDIVLAADTERTALLAEAETAEDLERIGYIYERLDAIGAYDAPSRAATILAGLGFSEEAQSRPISSFSGGWRMRVALAAVLFRQPDLLMLDEPTNHLDFEALIWLESYLARYSKTLIIISHDRDLLNKTVDVIVHLDQHKLVSYTGTYDQFERRRAERLMNQQALHEKQVAQKARMMEFVDRFRAKASKARQAQSRLKMIEKMDIVDAVIAERVTAFEFPEPAPLPSPLVRLEAVEAGYQSGQPVLKGLNLQIDADDRIALLGANGNGKSTLVKLLSGRLAPLAGQCVQSGKIKIGYFAQHQTDELDIRLTPYQLLYETLKTQPEPKVRAMLGRFGFDKHKADTKIGELSGGEKARLLFCLMSFDAPHLMLLDEPTNHLDIDAREALMQALNNYNGAVILVSHDPHLVECVADRLWLVADGGCKPYEDDLNAYKQLVIRQRKRERDEARNAAKAPKNAAKVSSPRETQRLELQMEQLQQQRETVEAEMAVAAVEMPPSRLPALQQQFQALVQQLEQVEEAWLAAQAADAA